MTSIQAQGRSARSRILVVDDEPHIRAMVIRALESAGHAIDSAADGSAGMALALAGDYQLVILDLVMPLADGRDIIRRLRRERPDAQVLVLSCLSDVTTKVAVLDMGAHDYLTKPFSIDELLARVRVQLRGEQPGGEHQPGKHQPGDLIRAGHLVLDLGRMQADAGVGLVPLTRLEVMLLRELMEHAGESVPKDSLLASVWGLDFNPGSNVVDVCVRRLRSKLGFDLIETVRGAGYRLAS